MNSELCLLNTWLNKAKKLSLNVNKTKCLDMHNLECQAISNTISIMFLVMKITNEWTMLFSRTSHLLLLRFNQAQFLVVLQIREELQIVFWLSFIYSIGVGTGGSSPPNIERYCIIFIY